MNDMKLVNKGSTAEFDAEKKDLVRQTQELDAESEKTLIKRSKMLALMTENNQNTHF